MFSPCFWPFEDRVSYHLGCSAFLRGVPNAPYADRHSALHVITVITAWGYARD